jgi:hypothetical protein
VAITWPTNDAWFLQQSVNLAAGWTNAPTQTSPAIIPATNAAAFFRLAKPQP